MEFLYAVINFLILAGLIFLFGRKPLASMLEARRKKIQDELDAAEAAESGAGQNPPSLSESASAGETLLTPEQLARPKVEEIQAETREALLKAEANGQAARLEVRREAISDLHRYMVSSIREQAIQMFSAEPYASRLREREGDMVRLILSRVSLTPGDIAYLKTHEVLYVTLTSAFPLPDELVRQVGDYTDRMLAAVHGKTSFWVRQDPALLGGLCLRIGDTVYDCSVKERLYQLERKMQKDDISGSESMEDVVGALDQDMERMTDRVYLYQLGRVLTVSDGICWMDGLADIMYGEVVEFSCGDRGMVLDIQPGRIGCIIYGDYTRIESGSRVRRVGRIASVPVGDVLLGRVVDALGHAIDGRGQIRTTERRPIEFQAPAILDRASVSEPLHTGIKAIDALVPIGRGQRELIIGDRQTGKTSLAIDTIINQKGKGVVCIYVAIGQKDSTVADIRAKLEKYGAMSYTIIVCATASASASLQYIAPFSGTAMGEYFMYHKRDVLIVYDDLSKHSVAYRELSLLLHRPSGREAYPGDIFYLHSRLLERSAKLSDQLGGGSMTALPILETLAGDISSYIPTNVISITDGQIFLDTELFFEGQRPAVNVGLSVSRVGSTAQTRLMKQVSGSLRMKLAQYRELSGFSQFGSDVDDDTKAVLDAGIRMMTVLKQGRFAPLPDWQQALLIYAVSEGYAKDVPVEKLDVFEKKLYTYMGTRYPALKQTLESGAKMDGDTRQALDAALSDFAEAQVWQESNS
jgi:F-type H+-transporting ATPase subunit alpha